VPYIFSLKGKIMAEKKFEDAMARLEEIVQDLEDGQLTLEESLKSFEEGMKLVNFCSNKLEEAEKKVNILIKDADGKHAESPFEPEEEDGS
jgi:exodeoxyribonuclease VII small subunit